jgi:hypothetical protein
MDFELHDRAELTRDFGRWPAGTTGTIVDTFPDGVVVELVSPSGETLDLLDLPLRAVQVVRRGAARASAPNPRRAA